MAKKIPVGNNWSNNSQFHTLQDIICPFDGTPRAEYATESQKKKMPCGRIYKMSQLAECSIYYKCHYLTEMRKR
jgi:hypothetical protein